MRSRYCEHICGSSLHSLDDSGNNGIESSSAVDYLKAFTRNLGFREIDQVGRIKRLQQEAFTDRLVMVMFGGIALVGLIRVVVLHRNTILISVSVARFAFAPTLALVAKDIAGNDVLGGRATYAALLVVIVGTSVKPSS